MHRHGLFSRHSRVISPFALSASLVACGGGGAPELDQAAEPIVNGTALTSSAAEALGMARIIRSNTWLCSGTLIRNDLVLTTYH
jgi:hypothetical protein